MKLSIIIPAFNEKKTIKSILEKIEKTNFGIFGKEIIIIDDGSSDGTAEILDNLKGKFKIAFHKNNKGKGCAVKTGLGFATGDYIIIQDADLEYDPTDMKKMLDFAVKNNAKVVYGSRILGNNPKSSWIYYLGGITLTFITNLIYNVGITDEATCYKMFHSSIFEKIRINSKKFEFCPEVTAKVANLGLTIYEVPISYNPRDKKNGKKIKLKDFFVAVLTLLKYKFKKND